ncbi:hypothetical protein CB1_022802001, partial [Camelus ferus]
MAPKIHVDCNNLTALAIRNPRAAWPPAQCVLGSGVVEWGAGGSRPGPAAPDLWTHGPHWPSPSLRGDGCLWVSTEPAGGQGPVWGPLAGGSQLSPSQVYQTECISGCVCPEGLLDDGQGGCVVEEQCPCVHNSDVYPPGAKIRVDCNTCTCQKGRWACTQSVCHGTCAVYGNGHYITFDGKYYDFDGHCSYVAVQDYCGQNSSLGSFSIVTENVPCGTTGVTCSKAIKIFL